MKSKMKKDETFCVSCPKNVKNFGKIRSHIIIIEASIYGPTYHIFEAHDNILNIALFFTNFF